MFFPTWPVSEELRVKWKSKQDGRKSVRLTVGSWKRLKLLEVTGCIRPVTVTVAMWHSLVSVNVSAPFRGGGLKAKRGFGNFPRLPQWMFCSGRMVIDWGRMALDHILAINHHHHHHHHGYPAYSHQSYSHQVGICHNDEGWEYDTVKFPPYPCIMISIVMRGGGVCGQTRQVEPLRHPPDTP